LHHIGAYRHSAAHIGAFVFLNGRKITHLHISLLAHFMQNIESHFGAFDQPAPFQHTNQVRFDQRFHRVPPVSYTGGNFNNSYSGSK
jgi:hypothetical protein